MILFLNLFYFMFTFETSDAISKIPKFQNDCINCYGNSLFQCLNNIKRLNYFLNINYEFPPYQKLSMMFQKMKKFDYILNYNKIRSNLLFKDVVHFNANDKQSENQTCRISLTQKQKSDDILDFSYYYNFLIKFINVQGLVVNKENDPIEFLELLLLKCFQNDCKNETSFYNDFKFEFDGLCFTNLNFPISNVQDELNKLFLSKPIRHYPKIAVIHFYYQPGNEDKLSVILKVIYIGNKKYTLNSLIINQRGHLGHFYAVLNIGNEFFKADNEYVKKIDFLDIQKGAYALFYEIEE